MLKGEVSGGPKPLWKRYQEAFDKVFHRFRSSYSKFLHDALTHRVTFFLAFCLLFGSALCLLPFVGRDFFPQVDAGQLRLHVQAPTGTRIEVTEEIFGEVEEEIRE